MQLEPIRFADPCSVLARSAAQLRPPVRLTVSAAAARYRKLDNRGGGISGDWSNDTAPHLVRPMDCLDPERGYSLVAVMGPSQCGKSAIGDNWWVWTVTVDPADMIFLGPDRDIVGSYMVKEFNKMIRASKDVQAKQLATPSADNIYSKEFAGCMLFAVWPVPAQLRARPVPRWRIDDYDAVPEDIGGEGNAITLLQGRQTTFEGYDMGYVNSSPALGGEKGIEALVARGTDERFHVDCLHCGAPFVLGFFEVLVFERDGTAEDARRSARVVCPSCGGIHEQRDKPSLLRSRGFEACWIGAGERALPGGRVEGRKRDTAIASFRFDGLMGFSSWGRLAALYREAEITFEQSQDEGELRGVVQSHIGVGYTSRVKDEDRVTADVLVARSAASDYDMGRVPDWAVCLTAAVDVQARSFEVGVVAWGPEWQSARVDRFGIHALDDGETAIRPARYPEHWGLLLQKVIWRRWPMQGDDAVSLPVLATAIDSGGLEGVTDNAFAFWATAVRAGVPPTAITLIKGGNNPKARLLPPPTIDTKRKVKGLPDPELYVPNVNRLKDTIDVRLRRGAPGPGFMAFPRGFPPAYVDELRAESKVDGLWQRARGQANESFDLEVYNLVNMLRLGGQDASLFWVPAWARPARRRAEAPIRPVDGPAVVTAAPHQPAAGAVRRPPIRTRSMRL